MPNGKIILDCERMKYPFTGLYSFCHHLGTALKKLDDKKVLTFYLPNKEKDIFGVDSNVIIQHSLHKFLMPSLRGYEIWHSTFQGTSYFPSSRKIKKILTVHDLNFLYDENKSPQKKSKELKKLQNKINNSDAVVAISKFVLNDLKNHLRIEDAKSHVIYNGCNFDSSSMSVQPSFVPDVPFLYTIGTITAKKNFHVLPALLQTYEGVLVISGITQSEEYKEKIIQEARKYHAENRLIFTGPVTEEEKKWYMQNCEVFVFPSLAEGFGLPVVEAMYLGKPLLLSNRTSLPEIGGDLASYFEGFDPKEMQSALANCFKKNNEAQLSEKLKERAKLFDWKNSATLYLSLYNQILNS